MFAVETKGSSSSRISCIVVRPQSQALPLNCSLVASYVRPVAATPASVTFLKITCSVTWTGNTGQLHTRTTEAYFGKYGLNLSYQKS